MQTRINTVFQYLNRGDANLTGILVRHHFSALTNWSIICLFSVLNDLYRPECAVHLFILYGVCSRGISVFFYTPCNDYWRRWSIACINGSQTDEMPSSYLDVITYEFNRDDGTVINVEKLCHSLYNTWKIVFNYCQSTKLGISIINKTIQIAECIRSLLLFLALDIRTVMFLSSESVYNYLHIIIVRKIIKITLEVCCFWSAVLTFMSELCNIWYMM